MNQQLVFKGQFEEDVKAGKKAQTIRPAGKFRDKLKVGDKVYLRSWEGSAYHSKQKKLGVGRVTEKFELWWNGVGFHWKKSWKTELEWKEGDDLAKLDGFANYHQMHIWFRENHPESKQMVVIRWELEK